MPISALSAVSDFASDRVRYVSNVMPEGLDYLNTLGQAKSLGYLNDVQRRKWYLSRMVYSSPHHDWHLKEWLAATGKKQSDIVRDLEWNKARISLMVSGKQPYTRDAVNELAAYLNIRPFELLMHPEDAMALRAMKADLSRIADMVRTEEAEDGPKKVSIG